VSDCCTPKGYRTIFSEKSARAEVRRYRSKGLDRLSRRIAELVKERGVEGRTMLEVGGGIGTIEIELLKAGVKHAVNVELTPTYEEAAGELLRETGLVDRVERRVMDFVETGADVEAADYVVLNRVICCYPDMPRLTAAAAERVRQRLVLTFPNSRWWTRLGLTIVNRRAFGRILLPGLLIAIGAGQVIPFLNLFVQEKFGLDLVALNGLWQVTALDRPT